MSAIEYFQQQKSTYLDELFELLRIPSISREQSAVRQAADWLVKRLQQTADSVEQIETSGNPAILAEWNPQLPGKSDHVPTVLIYGHYDVQPPDPLDQWDSPPFEPQIRDGRIFARGAGDNKGQFFAHLCAVESVHCIKQLGLKVKFLLDGEEEIGSPHLQEAFQAKQDFFRDVDLTVVSDGPASPSWKPELCFGVRGLLCVQFEVSTADSDVHSGNFGGIQPNPVWALMSILQTMRDENGKCLIEGFYDDVFTPEPEALEAAQQSGDTPDTYKEQLGISYFGGEQDQPLIHRVMFRPTCNINGFQAGSVRERARTIVPKEAVAELDLRLVPNQTPETIEAAVRAHLQKLRQRSEQWATILDRCTVRFGDSFYPMHTPLNLPWTAPLVSAIEKGFGQSPIKIPIKGGSLPLYDVYKATGKPLYQIPYAQPDEANHAPNESLMLDWFEKGVQTSIHLFTELGNMKKEN